METKDSGIRDQLVANHLGLVCRLCRRFQGIGEAPDNLIRAGTRGLVKAIDNYDPQSGGNFSDIATASIVEEIKASIRYRGWGANAAANLQLCKIAVGRAAETLTQQLGHSPNVAQIAESAGLSEEEVYLSFEVEGLSSTVSMAAEDRRDAITISGILGEDAFNLAPFIGGLSLPVTSVRVHLKTQAVLFLRDSSGLSPRAIARRLGISPIQVARLQRHAAAKFRFAPPERISS